MIRLGLIGDNIGRSHSPQLHRIAGELCGRQVSYEPLIPARLGLDFDTVFDRCLDSGFHGINVTYPYKERVVARVAVPVPLVRELGACNTVIFRNGAGEGFNTDCTGFSAAFRNAFPETLPGRVAIAGAGGVGKAIAFALLELNAKEIAIYDPDQAKAQALANALGRHNRENSVRVATSIVDALEGADGIVNATPLGMLGKPGNAFARADLGHADWAFDAVYTPSETEFMADARASGLEILSGYELFFYQGVHAFQLFTGCLVDEERLRTALPGSAQTAQVTS